MAKEARVPVNVRLGPGGVAWLDKVASGVGRSRSEALRASLVVARAHEREVESELRRQI